MISDKKRLEIATFMYANVAGEFAMMNNPKNCGPTFTWERFIDNCEEGADLWVMIHHIRGDQVLIKSTAKQMAKEIAQNLGNRLRK